MEFVRVGRIVNTHGIRGQLKVMADTDFASERFAPGEKLWIVHNGKSIRTVTVDKAQVHKGTYLISFDGMTNINEVEAYKGMWLAITSDQQHELEEDEFYHHEIIGLTVHTTQGKELGTIKEILQLGSNDVWIVKRTQNNKKDALIPYIEDVVKEVDLVKGVVLIELMEGLIDDED